MKKHYCRISLLFILLCSLPAIAADPVIIDVRSESEFNSGHVQGALLMPYDRIGSLIGNQVSDKETDIILYCRSGRRAGIAKKTLESLGYTSVTNAGGLNDMKGKYPVVK